VPFKGSYLPGKWIEPTTDDTLLWSGSEQAWPFRDKARPAPRPHRPVRGLGRWQGVDGKAVREGRRAGAEVHTDSRALTLIIDRAHAVVGVVARMDGVEKFIRAHKG
jgi:3-oxo-5alpha-steroid 4-dehydrogenase